MLAGFFCLFSSLIENIPPPSTRAPVEPQNSFRAHLRNLLYPQQLDMSNHDFVLSEDLLHRHLSEITPDSLAYLRGDAEVRIGSFSVGSFLKWWRFERVPEGDLAVAALVSRYEASGEDEQGSLREMMWVIKQRLNRRDASFKVAFWRAYNHFERAALARRVVVAFLATDELPDFRRSVSRKPPPIKVPDVSHYYGFQVPEFVEPSPRADTPQVSPSSDTAGATARRQERKDRRVVRRMVTRIIRRLTTLSESPKVRAQRQRRVKEPKMTAYAWKTSCGPFRLGCCLQSGRKTTRAERDELQREAAKAREKRLWRSKPKEQREREVYKNRDKRSPVLQAGKRDLAIGVGVTLVASKVWSLLNRAGKLTGTVSEVIKTFKGLAEGLRKVLNGAFWTVPLLCIAWFAFDKFDNLGRTAIVAAVSALVGKTIWNHVSEFFPAGNVELQGGVNTPIGKLLATIFAFSVFGGKFTQRDVTEFGKRVGSIGRVADGFDTFSKWFMEAFEHLINFVRKRFGKEQVQIFKDSHSTFKKWLKEVDEIAKAEFVDGPADPKRIDKMVDLTRVGYGFKELYRGTELQRLADEYVAKLGNITIGYAGVISSRDNIRIEPTMITLVGEPGIGKTVICSYACVALLCASGIVEEPSMESCLEQIWQKGSSEYWNGYCGQKALVMDDIFQARVAPGMPDNEYMDVIRAVGSWIMPLNMADLNSKGKFSMKSEVIFSTTNLRCIASEAGIVLQEPAAVARRISFPYAMRLRPEFAAGGRLDRRLFEAELAKCVGKKGFDGFPWYIWEVAKHDFMTGQTSSEWMPIREMLTCAAIEIKRRRDVFSATRESLANFAEGFKDDGPKLQVGPLGILAASSAATLFGLKKIDPKSYWACETAALMKANTGVPLGEALRYADAYLQAISFRQARVSRLSTWLYFGACGTLVGVTIAGLLRIVWAGLCKLFKFRKPSSNVKVQSNVPRGKREQAEKVPTLHSGTSTTAVSVYNNTYKLCSNEVDILGQIIMLESDLAVQPFHFTQSVRHSLAKGLITEDSILHLRHAVNDKLSIALTVRQYLGFKRFCFEEGDVEFLRFKDVRAHKVVSKYFLKESELKYVSGLKGQVMECLLSAQGPLKGTVNYTPRPFSGGKFERELVLPADWGCKVIKRVLRYRDVRTDLGSCGAPVCIWGNDSFTGRTVYGIHVAGSVETGDGYCAFVTAEMIQKAKSALDVITDNFEADFSTRKHGVTLQVGEAKPFDDMGSFLPIGTVDKPVAICPKTSYYVTKHHGELGPSDQLPAALGPVYRDGELVYPMVNAVKPYQSEILLYDLPYMKTAMHVATSRFVQLTRDVPRRIFTIEEAILGVPTEKFRSIPRGTAAGYPYVNVLRDGKKSFFGDGDVYDLTTPECVDLFSRVEYIVQSAKDNVRLSHVFVDFNKDELRSAAKVQQVATRLISSSPVDYTVAWRMYFGAITAAAMRINVDTGMAPGICSYTDWWRVATHLRQKGDKVFDGDFKAFDSSEQSVVHSLILDFVNSWYDDGPENARIRTVLWEDLAHSRHIGGRGTDQRYVYQWNKSLPSGHPFTTIVNSIYSLFLLVCAYIECTGDLTGFWNHVHPLTYGDDNNTNVSDEVAEVYNQATVAVVLKEKFGITYTPGNKGVDFVETMTLEETTFLKRGFTKGIDGAWSCPLALDSFLYTVYWCKNRRLEAKITHDVLECALEELSLHSPPVWNEYAPKIARLLEREGHVTRVPCEQSQYLALVRTRKDNWY